MKELKNTEYIYNKEFDINIKPYLSIYEIMVIVEDIIKLDNEDGNVVQNRILEDLLILQLATDISDTVGEESLLTNDFYDLALQNGLIEVVRKTVKNAYMIRNFYEEYMYVNRIIKRGFDNLLKVAEKATKSLPKTQKGWSSIIDKFGEVINKDAEHNITGSDISTDSKRD